MLALLVSIFVRIFKPRQLGLEDLLLLRLKPFEEGPPIGACEHDGGTIRERKDRIAVSPCRETDDGIDIHDLSSMHAHEALVNASLDGTQRH
jgi:hypothetical protein